MPDLDDIAPRNHEEADSRLMLHAPNFTKHGHRGILIRSVDTESNRKVMNRNWSNQKANPALKTKTGNR